MTLSLLFAHLIKIMAAIASLLGELVEIEQLPLEFLNIAEIFLISSLSYLALVSLALIWEGLL